MQAERDYSFQAKALLKVDQGSWSMHVVLAGKPSRPGAMGGGYCGAGEEVALLLIAENGRGLALTNDVLLGSCLKSIELGQGESTMDDVSRALSVDRLHSAIYFRWPGDAETMRRVLTIAGSHFHIVLQPAPRFDSNQ